MSNEMVERAAKALSLAVGNAPFYVMPQYRNKAIVYETLPPGHMDCAHSRLIGFEEAEILCGKLNNEWIVKEIIKSLKPASDDMQNKYYKLAKAEGHSDISACFDNGKWERSLSAILSGE